MPLVTLLEVVQQAFAEKGRPLSVSRARRIIARERAIRVNGRRVSDPEAQYEGTLILQRGPRATVTFEVP